MKTVPLTLAALSLLACTRSKPVDERSTVITEATPPRAGAGAAMDEQDRAGTTTLTSAAWIGNDTAMARIAVSRCARESACAKTGPNAHEVDPTACVTEMRSRMWSSLRADICPSGIKGDPLDECIQAIQHESCNNPLETLSRLTQCRTSELCGK